MTPTQIEDAVRAALAPVESVLITTVRDVYATVATKYHEPDDGCNSQTFGFLVYHFLRHNITTTAQDIAQGIDVEVDSPFRFRVGQFRFGLYGLGPHAVDTIDDAFPNNHNAAGEFALENVQYRFEFGVDAYMPHALVIGHLGNCESGCEQIWLAEPLQECNCAITGWGWSKMLWRWDGQQRADSAAPEPVLPAPAPARPIVLTRKKSAEEKPAG